MWPSSEDMSTKPRPLRSTIGVEAAAGLATEITRGDHLLEQRRRSVLRIVEIAVEHVHDREEHVEADQVGKRERSERMVAAQLHPVVDLLRARYPFRVQKHRLV